MRFQEQGTLPTGVFATSNELAQGFIKAETRSGVRCPQDISVMGFGDRPERSPEAGPRLTTIAFNSDAAAVETMRLIRKQMAGNPGHPERVLLPTHLVVGETTGPPPQQERN